MPSCTDFSQSPGSLWLPNSYFKSRALQRLSIKVFFLQVWVVLTDAEEISGTGTDIRTSLLPKRCRHSHCSGFQGATTLLQHRQDGNTPCKAALWDKGCFLDSPFVRTMEQSPSGPVAQKSTFSVWGVLFSDAEPEKN